MLDLLFSKRSLENPDTSLSDPANWLFEALGSQPTSSKVLVNEDTAIQLTAVWSAVNTISDTLAELPLQLVQKKRDHTTRVINKHPTLRLLDQPNEFMTPIVMKSTKQSHTLLRGNSYGMIARTRGGEPFEIWPLDPSQTDPQIKNGKLWYRTMLDTGVAYIEASDIIHIPALARNGIKGMSIIGAQREALGHSIAVQNYGSKFFANGAKPGGLLSFEKKITDPAKVRKAVEEQYSGDNVHGLLVLDNGAKFSTTSIPPEDAQFLQTKEYSVDDIGRMFRLPAHFLNKMGQATFNNLEQMGSHFVQYTLTPWLTRWEQEYTRKLLTQAEIDRGYRFRFVIAELIRGDVKTRSEVYASGINTGWLTRNEARAREDLPPIEGLDDPLVPANMKVLGDEPEPAPSPPPPTEPEPEEEPAEETEEDETEEEDRMMRLLRSAGARLSTKEINAVTRMVKRNAPKEDIFAFYAKHSLDLVDGLAIDPKVARQYCRYGAERASDNSYTIDELVSEMRAAILGVLK